MAEKKVLLAEDEAKLRKLAGFALARAGVDLDLAEDGAEAVKMARAKKYDLILLDLMMPNVDGFQALEQLRGHKSTAEVKVVVLSARADLDAVSRVKDFKIAGYIKKPYSPSFLAEKVLEFLGG